MAPEVSAFVLMGTLFAAYLLGVRVIEDLSLRLRSITFIKSIHLLIFLVASGLLAGLLFEVVWGRVGYLSWITIAIFFAEGVVLRFNRGRCPLTAIAERLGSVHGQVTDMFLPKWFADRVFVVYTWLFVGALLILGVRQLV
jgi:hypothetical protein